MQSIFCFFYFSLILPGFYQALAFYFNTWFLDITPRQCTPVFVQIDDTSWKKNIKFYHRHYWSSLKVGNVQLNVSLLKVMLWKIFKELYTMRT